MFLKELRRTLLGGCKGIREIYGSMPLRLHAEWITQTDERLLKYIQEEGGGSPSEITDNWPFEYHQKHIGRRLRKLEAAGFLKRIGPGSYILSDRGEAYLAGEFDARELEDPTEEAD